MNQEKVIWKKKSARKETSDETPNPTDTLTETPDPADKLADAIEKLSVQNTDDTDKEPLTVNLVNETAQEISSSRLEKRSTKKERKLHNHNLNILQEEYL